MQKLKKKPLLPQLLATLHRALASLESFLGPLTSLPSWLVAIAWIVPLILVVWVFAAWVR